ncbi:MAG: hypothetical protein M3Y91_15180 [Actinomycetota bacterium]|nr:hypothetical protein [Actinomycetota bacterium]
MPLSPALVSVTTNSATTRSAATGFAGSSGGSTSFSQFFSQPGGLGPWIQGVARFVAVGVIILGLFLVVKNVARGRGAAAFKDLTGAVLASAVLSDLSLLGVVTDFAIKTVGLIVTTVSTI